MWPTSCKEGAIEEDFSWAMDLTEKAAALEMEKLCTGEIGNREHIAAVAEGNSSRMPVFREQRVPATKDSFQFVIQDHG